MRIVITGASGNVGTALLRALADTDDDILALARRPPGTEHPPYARARWLACDIGAPAAATELDAAMRVPMPWSTWPGRCIRIGTIHRCGGPIAPAPIRCCGRPRGPGYGS